MTEVSLIKMRLMALKLRAMRLEMIRLGKKFKKRLNPKK